VHQLLIDFKKAYDLVRKQVLLNNVTEFGISVRLERLINETRKANKMNVNETCSRVWVRLTSVLHVSY